jgi:hypothetical protein
LIEERSQAQVSLKHWLKSKGVYEGKRATDDEEIKHIQSDLKVSYRHAG